jgi:RNA polymerase-binding transcription factor DksA
MGKVISLVQGRRRLREPLPKPRICEDCDEPIETARLQVQPKARRCASCENTRERRHKRVLLAMRDNDIAIIKG